MGDKLMGARANPDAEAATKFLERLDLMERVMALEAREKVVRGNLKRGEEQLVRPRERYKGCRTVKLSTAKLALDHFEDKGPLVHYWRAGGTEKADDYAPFDGDPHKSLREEKDKDDDILEKFHAQK